VVRVSNNYQRVGFDIDPYGRMLGSASQDGRVRLWDITQGSPVELSTSLPTCPDAINTFQFHPFMPYWCIATGQRHYGSIGGGEETSDDDSSDDETSSTSSPRITPINQIIVGSFENMSFGSN
jgi:WD40 repeat protein